MKALKLSNLKLYNRYSIFLHIDSKITNKLVLKLKNKGFSEFFLHFLNFFPQIENLSLIIDKTLEFSSINFWYNFNHLKIIDSTGIKSLHDHCEKFNNLSFLFVEISMEDLSLSTFNMLLNLIGKLKNIKNLDLILSDNNLGNNEISSLSSSILNLKYLTRLSLDISIYFGEIDNMITIKGLISFCDSIVNLINLINLTLFLHGHEIGDLGAIEISRMISLLPNLESLNLSLEWCGLSDSGALALSSSINKLKKLENLQLYLMMNIISNEVKDTFPLKYRETIFFDMIDK